MSIEKMVVDEIPVNEKALWLAVLVCSTQDLCGIAARGGFRDKERVQRRARAWFESDDDDVGSFVWTCDVLGLEVRAGFVPHVRREIMAKMKAVETEICPFANLPEKGRTQWALTREEMTNCHWLKPKLVAQIDFTEWTPDGHLRHAAFVGLRRDKNARDVLREPR